MKKIMLTTIIFLFAFSSIAKADYCPQTISTGEGNYPIREEQFTMKKAESAHKYIGLFVKNGIKSVDLAKMKNRITMIKGYLLKTQINEDKPETKKVFCDFIKNEAFLLF